MTRIRGRTDNTNLNINNFKFHGNWCGPGWSNGKWQESVLDGDAPAIDALDQVCKTHDIAYAKARSQKNRVHLEYHADMEFLKSIMYNPTIKGIAASIGIGTQSLLSLQAAKHFLLRKCNPPADPTEHDQSVASDLLISSTPPVEGK